MAKLTKTFVDSVKVTNKDQKIPDSELKGFCFRVRPSGAKSWIIRYRFHGAGKVHTLGKYGELTPAQARTMAQERLAMVRQDIDPNHQRTARREALTLASFAIEYFKYAETHKTAANVNNQQGQFKNHILPKLGKKKLEDIKSKDIGNLHRALHEKKTTANRVLALISHMFTIAIEWDYVKDNPATKVKKFPENKRIRYLSKEELIRLYEAMDNHPNKQGVDIVRMLLLTGARSGEVFEMQWSGVNWEVQQWVKVAAETKSGKDHIVPLNAPTLLLLDEIRQQQKLDGGNSSFVFPSPSKNEDEARDSIKRFFEGLIEQAGIKDCHVHDLRHTYASHLAIAGISIQVICALLGHADIRTTMRYAHLSPDPQDKAAGLIGNLLDEVAGIPKQTAEVIPLHGIR